MIAVGTTPITPLVLADHLNPQPDGTVVVIRGDGLAMVPQPDGSIIWYDAATAGVYANAIVIGNLLIYNSGGTPYAFAYFGKVPNA